MSHVVPMTGLWRVPNSSSVKSSQVDIHPSLCEARRQASHRGGRLGARVRRRVVLVAAALLLLRREVHLLLLLLRRLMLLLLLLLGLHRIICDAVHVFRPAVHARHFAEMLLRVLADGVVLRTRRVRAR